MMMKKTLQTTSLMMIMLQLLMQTILLSALPRNKQLNELQSGCLDPVSPRRGTFQMSSDGSSVEFFCKLDHYLVGGPIAVCQNRVWSSLAPVCVGRDCDTTNMLIRHGTTIHLHGGGIIRFECRKGFKINGDEMIACIDGQWNATKPDCSSDDKLKSLKNERTLVNGDSKTERKVELDETKKINHVQRLMTADYSCIRNNFSIHPPVVTNARSFTNWAMYDGRPRLYTTYQCKWGYELARLPSSSSSTATRPSQSQGEGKYLYCRDGAWIGSIPKCQAVVKDEELQMDVFHNLSPPLTHEQLLRYADYSCVGSGMEASVDPPVSDETSSTLKFIILDGRPHLYLQFECDEGFKADDQFNYLYCKNRTWIGNLPKCVKEKKLSSCSIKNGFCDQLCSHSSSNQVLCSCKNGYELQEDKRTCIDIDECELNNGGCDHFCDNTEGGYECSCFHGYDLVSMGTKCLRKIDEILQK